MKKYLLTSLAMLSIALAFGQNYVSGSIGLYGPSYNAATTIPTGGQALVSAAGNWWFGGIVSKRAGTGSFTFNGTGTYSNALLTSYTDGVVTRTGSNLDFTFPVGDAGATVGGVYHPLMVSAASAVLTTSVIYNASSTTPNPTLLGSGVGKVDPIANWGFTSAAANATVTLTTRDETGIFGAAGIYVAGFNTTLNVWEKLGVATPILVGGNTLVSNAAIDLSKYSAFTAAGDVNGVPLTAKLFLQAVMTNATTMRNLLQTTAKLPTASPFTAAPATYASINSTAGVAGNVVDWILVKVVSASNGTTILEQKSLLLKTDGSIVDVNGAVPVFADQAGTSVRIIFQPRNHMRVATTNFVTGVNAFTGTQSYNFTTGQAQAYKGATNTQMTFTFGVYALAAGDNLSDGAIDISDFNNVDIANTNGFAGYVLEDLNMDGYVDITDFNWVDTNAGIGFFYSVN